MKRLRSEQGISMIMVAMALFLLMGAAAIAVDLAAMRLDRSADQKVTDSAASAGALAAFAGNGQDACEAALAYVEVNAQGISSLDTSGCLTSFSAAACDAATLPQSYTPPAVDRFSVTVTYPVPNGDPLMTSGLLGGSGQTLVAEDGEQCERVAVQMSATHTSLFAQLLGFDQGTTTVHSVARSFDPGADGPPLNLLVLDRTGCNAIHVQGNGGVIVEKVTDPVTGDEFPGVAAADSDASSGCSPSVILVDGANSTLRADGKPGCPSDTLGTGEGCGVIQSIAPGTPGCNPLACTPGAGGANPPIPEPIGMGGRITRVQVDHEYNCWPNYAAPPAGTGWAVSPLTSANEQDIPGCTGSNDHIYDLINLVGQNGPVGGFNTWTQPPLNLPCTIPSSNPGFTVTGDVRIDCADFVVQSDVTIEGNVVFDGNVNVTSGSANFTIDNTSGTGWAFFRDGHFVKDGQASLTILDTMVYLSDDSQITMNGGSTGTLRWVAPDAGDFDDLALWSDSPSTHVWAGQASLIMEGVFFSPWATADYSGAPGAGQNQTDAQWVADKLVARGNGVLRITPKFEFPVKVDGTPRTTIIR